uniref:C2H2-type domain-containing protein n=1 Tax=Culex tarsalis TaxID=7177 RepID=A0A1Q3FIG3_CULTA
MSAPTNRKNLPTAHTPVTTGFRCEFCQGFFARQYLLKTHQHKLHGLPRTTAEQPRPEVAPQPQPALPPLPLPSITTLVLPAIETPAMAVAKSRGEIPFAVLHIANEIPLIVRVLQQGPVSILKAAENSDFRESQRGCPVGPSVSIAVVASIYQKFAEDGTMYFVIRGPVSRYQATMPAEQPVDQPELEPEVPEGVLRESLDGGDIYKTLTQINCVQSDLKPVKASPNRVTAAKSSSSSSLKRKNPNRNGPKAARKPVTSTPKKPKVITLVDDLKWQNQNVSPNRANYQNIGTGPLLSPIRHHDQQHPEDPLADINFQDLIHVDDDGLLPNVMDDLSGDFL